MSKIEFYRHMAESFGLFAAYLIKQQPEWPASEVYTEARLAGHFAWEVLNEQERTTIHFQGLCERLADV